VSRLRPSLDDLTHAGLTAEAIARIPGLAPQWTDHNPADPGITLVELFAWLTEALVYRVDRIPADHYDAILALLGSPPPPDAGGDREAAVATALAELSRPWRATTAADIDMLLRQDWTATAAAQDLAGIARVHCVAGRDLTQGPQPAPGHLSIVVLPQPTGAVPDQLPIPSADLCAAVTDWLEPRRLLGVRHHVLGPSYVPIAVTGRMVLRPDYAPPKVISSGLLTDPAIIAETQALATRALQDRTDPLTGGPTATGWPFGRPIHLSELYRLLDGLAGVDHVDDLRFAALPPEREIRYDGRVIGAALAEHELPDLTLGTGFSTVVGDPAAGAR
jgi:hypothetical protein